MSLDNMVVFTGNANPALAELVVRPLGLPLGKAVIGRFSDGEIQVEIMEHVRGKDVFVIQPTCSPSNDNLMELLILMDAVKRSSAKRITAVIPFYGFARKDRRPRTARAIGLPAVRGAGLGMNWAAPRTGRGGLGARAEVAVAAPGPGPLAAEVVEIAPVADRQSNTVKVAVRGLHPPPLLRPDMSARVTIQPKRGAE